MNRQQAGERESGLRPPLSFHGCRDTNNVRNLKSMQPKGSKAQ